MPSSALNAVALSRASTEVLAGERSSLSPRSLCVVLQRQHVRGYAGVAGQGAGYLSTSFARAACVFLRLGWGMRHSMPKAVQFVHGMPSEAASQRT